MELYHNWSALRFSSRLINTEKNKKKKDKIFHCHVHVNQVTYFSAATNNESIKGLQQSWLREVLQHLFETLV